MNSFRECERQKMRLHIASLVISCLKPILHALLHKVGRFKTAFQLFDGKTQRAIEWANGLHTEEGLDDNSVPAVEAIRYSIDHDPPVKVGNRMIFPVGGAVNAVKLTSDNVQWLLRKPTCPKEGP
jgi:hypothetical protein